MTNCQWLQPKKLVILTNQFLQCSSMNYFPQNTVANFRVKLADRIVLPGQWEVALTGLHYPAAQMEHGQNWRAANVHI